MSLSGVLENTEVLDKAGDGVCRFGEAYGSFPENFKKIKHMESGQDFPLSMSFKSNNGVLEDMFLVD